MTAVKDAAPTGCLICHRSPVAVVALWTRPGALPLPYCLCRACWGAFSPTVLAGLVEQLLAEQAP